MSNVTCSRAAPTHQPIHRPHPLATDRLMRRVGDVRAQLQWREPAHGPDDDRQQLVVLPTRNGERRELPTAIYYAYGGIGVGVGVQVGVGGSVQVSNAQTIYDLSGPFNNTSFHGGAGAGGSVDFFTGNSANGPVTGGGVTFGASAGASASITQTTTQICGSQGCVGPISDLLSSGVTPAAAATLSQPALTPATGSSLSSKSSVSPIAPTGGQLRPSDLA